MAAIALNLVVLRSADLDRLAAFYTKLGLVFSRRRHGSGPEHFAAELEGSVFELSPLGADGATTTGARVGFTVPSLDAVVSALSDTPGAIIVSPKDSPWGRRAVIADPDGHKVELIERKIVGSQAH